MCDYIADLHMHVVPDYDDGAIDLQMSLQMLKMAYEQGVRVVYCTSHGGYKPEDTEQYMAMFQLLRKATQDKFPDMTLYTGCEMLVGEEYIDENLYCLEIGMFLPLGNTRYVLTELYTDTTPEEAKDIVSEMLENGRIPVLAHVERYPGLFTGVTIAELIEQGAFIQVNAYSLNEESDEDMKARARYLVENQYAHFIGSDAHRSDHRPPEYNSGIDYLKQNCSKEYADALCFGNAKKLLMTGDRTSELCQFGNADS